MIKFMILDRKTTDGDVSKTRQRPVTLRRDDDGAGQAGFIGGVRMLAE